MGQPDSDGGMGSRDRQMLTQGGEGGETESDRHRRREGEERAKQKVLESGREGGEDRRAQGGRETASVCEVGAEWAALGLLGPGHPPAPP